MSCSYLILYHSGSSLEAFPVIPSTENVLGLSFLIRQLRVNQKN